MTDDHSMLGRVLLVIEVCLDRSAPVSLTELADATGLPKPTVWRIAQSLVQRRVLERSDDGYRGGMALATMGNRVTEQTALRAAVIPHLSELHARTHAAVWVVDVRSDTDWPTIGSLYGTVTANMNYAEWWEHNPRKPAVLASALGILALRDRPDRADHLIREAIPRLTPYTEVEPARVRASLQHARDRGAVIEHEQFVLGWSCLTVPILDMHINRMTAVLGIVDRTPRFDGARLLPAAHTSATAIARTLHTTTPAR